MPNHTLPQRSHDDKPSADCWPVVAVGWMLKQAFAPRGVNARVSMQHRPNCQHTRDATWAGSHMGLTPFLCPCCVLMLLLLWQDGGAQPAHSQPAGGAAA